MSSSDHGDDAEPDSQTIDLVRVLAEMRNESKRRKEAKRKAIESEYKSRVQNGRIRIQQLKETHEAKVSAAQTQQYATLRHLLHKRQLLELEIWKSIQRVEGEKNDLVKLLDDVYAERLEVCLEVLTTRKVRHVEQKGCRVKH